MNRTKRILIILFVPILVLLSFPLWRLYRKVQQQRINQALIAAIQAEDNAKILEALAEGASGEARNTGAPPNFRELLFHMWDQFRHTDIPFDVPTGDDKHLPALLLLYRQADDTANFRSPGPDLAIVRALLDHGAQVNDRDAGGRSPLFYATKFSNADSVRLLLARGADIESVNEIGCTPLACANAEITQVLLEHGANVNAKNKYGMTPLMWAACLSEADVVSNLLKHAADIEAVDGEKKTTLIWAAEFYHPNIIRILLEHGAKVSPKDAFGWTALDYAKSRRSSNPQGLSLLHRYGAK